jgi:VIT1/CCC1 family predicted Fe2+/Mn2+ transporter
MTLARMPAGKLGQTRRMPKRGPVPLAVHVLIEPVVAVVFILAPFVLGFESSEARILSIVIGVVILVVGMSTRWRLSLVELVPLRMHFMGDVLLGVVSIVAPVALGFGDETAATISFVVMGVGELGTAFGTAWEAGDDIAGARPRPARHEPLSS